MKKICKKFKIFGLLLMLVFAMAGAASVSNPVRVEAASKKGFQTIGGKQYYILQSGAKAKGWLTLTDSKTNEKRKYYFDPKTGVQKKGWLTLNEKKYYLGSGNLRK